MWFLYNEENVPDHRAAPFQQLKEAAVKTGRAWAIKEDFREIWRCPTAEAAAAFFKKWHWWATHSRLAPKAGSAGNFEMVRPSRPPQLSFIRRSRNAAGVRAKEKGASAMPWPRIRARVASTVGLSSSKSPWWRAVE